jgi:hypothetical protein
MSDLQGWSGKVVLTPQLRNTTADDERHNSIMGDGASGPPSQHPEA